MNKKDPKRTQNSSRRRKFEGFGGLSVNTVVHPACYAGGDRWLLSHDRGGHMTYNVKNRQSAEEEEERASPYGEWYMQSRSENSEANRVNKAVGGCGGRSRLLA